MQGEFPFIQQLSVGQGKSAGINPPEDLFIQIQAL